MSQQGKGRIAARLLDDDHSDEVLGAVTVLTGARWAANATLRFSGPFIAIIGRGLGVSLGDMGVALSVGELSGVTAPAVGRAVDRQPRRRAMVAGLAMVATAAALAAASPNVAVFAVAFTMICVGKIVFDSAMGAWIADRVAYERRSQITGFTETSWALAMLVAVPLLGIVTAVSSWRVAFAIMAIVGAQCSWLVHRHIADAPARVAHRSEGRSVKAMLRVGWPVYIGFGVLMTAANCVFVVFGAWFQDSFGMSTVQVAVTATTLGLAELMASLGSMRFTDRVGKRRSVVFGAAVMAPVGCALGFADHSVVAGIVLIAVYFLAFEYAIVSGIPLIGEIMPTARASSIGLAVGLGTVGRGISAIVATRAYDEWGIVAPGLMAAGCATTVVLLYGFGARRLHQ
ncbi:MAG: MFS transporter [Acidimicrobiia bacterium]